MKKKPSYEQLENALRRISDACVHGVIATNAAIYDANELLADIDMVRSVNGNANTSAQLAESVAGKELVVPQTVTAAAGMVFEMGMHGWKYRLVRHETDTRSLNYGYWECVQESGPPEEVGRTLFISSTLVKEAVSDLQPFLNINNVVEI